LLRIAEEAVRNAVKHGEPQRILISLSQTPRAITLKVSDDGQGFAPVVTEPEGVCGTALMQRHARAAGITLKIKSTLGKGTVVSCGVPRR
jgi:signal transduction histidine kinase